MSHHDDLSISLFADSFDTAASEPLLRATFDRDPPPPLPQPPTPPLSPNPRLPSSTSSTSKNDIAIPDLKHCGRQGRSDCSLADSPISPIKVSYNDDHREPQVAPRREAYAEDMNWPCDSNGDVQPPVSNPVHVIRFAAEAFAQAQLSYKLPCLHGVDQCPVNMSTYGQIRQYKPSAGCDTPLLDTSIATMRVEAAICAFGGTLNQRRSPARNQDTQRSIFRLMNEPNAHSTSRRLYHQQLPQRFVLSGSRISWDLEENPPITVLPPEAIKDEGKDTTISGLPTHEKKTSPSTDSRPESLEIMGGGGGTTTQSSPTSLTLESGNNKMKYRCKLCGQLKNNHLCPYRQPLQRSIGVMVFPAVNSFTAFEPGTIAAPLTTMNNFVSYDSDQTGSAYHQSQQVPPMAVRTAAAEDMSHAHHQQHQNHHCQLQHDAQADVGDLHPHPPTISPEAQSSAGSSGFFHSPQSSLSNQSEDVMVATTPIASETNRVGSHNGRHSTPSAPSTTSRKRTYDQLEQTGPTSATAPNRSGGKANNCGSGRDESEAAKRDLFVTSFALRPEHYRSVTQSSRDDSPTSYQYPTIPLTFAERKRLSDTLFILSKEVPNMTTECAVILRDARANNEWDMAAAELMAQLVVGLFCTEEDLRLEGLQRYLLTLGVSC